VPDATPGQYRLNTSSAITMPPSASVASASFMSLNTTSSV
jgi:hypothetical protein